MIIRNTHYLIFSQNSNNHYWEQDVYPDWTPFAIIRHFPDQRIGAGVEPHYHDCDEIWLFSAGTGEVWLDDERYAITPNTLVYTPMGGVHHFQMYRNGENNAIVTRLERQKRPIHIVMSAIANRAMWWPSTCGCGTPVGAAQPGGGCVPLSITTTPRTRSPRQPRASGPLALSP